MTVSPASGRAPAHTRLAQWAVGLAFAAGVMIAFGFGGGGMLVSVAAFAVAVVAKVRKERWALLWLPLLLFPALIASSPLWV